MDLLRGILGWVVTLVSCSFRRRSVHRESSFPPPPPSFCSLPLSTSFKIDVVFRTCTSRAGYHFHDRRSERGHVAAEFALSSPALVSPRWRLLRDNNAFPRFIWHRRRNNSTANFTRRERRPRIHSPAVSVLWQRTYDLHRSDIPCWGRQDTRGEWLRGGVTWKNEEKKK